MDPAREANRNDCRPLPSPPLAARERKLTARNHSQVREGSARGEARAGRLGTEPAAPRHARFPLATLLHRSPTYSPPTYSPPTYSPPTYRCSRVRLRSHEPHGALGAETYVRTTTGACRPGPLALVPGLRLRSGRPRVPGREIGREEPG